MELHRGWTIASSCWNFLRKRWLDREQELITGIQEETKCAEEKEEAGYRSPTWSILRALQKINKAKRLEGEAVMSAPPFFQSAGQGDLKFLGEDDGPTVFAWESFFGFGAGAVKDKMGKSKDWMVCCSSRKIDEEQRPFDDDDCFYIIADGREIFSYRSKQAKAKAGEKMDKKGGNGQSVL